jgi:hypothetical protein
MDGDKIICDFQFAIGLNFIKIGLNLLSKFFVFGFPLPKALLFNLDGKYFARRS